eukprot:TRINITY_DN21_c0_g6_i1.p1 TRINITY_DN21_c0_g6~~TRINITY_DN21_c0_g6_i1.p1  ORF type:complete len:488 (+),score=131.74 TRINITY_DN21_c0_g6_i1:117-1580(+)
MSRSQQQQQLLQQLLAAQGAGQGLGLGHLGGGLDVPLGLGMHDLLPAGIDPHGLGHGALAHLGDLGPLVTADAVPRAQRLAALGRVPPLQQRRPGDADQRAPSPEGTRNAVSNANEQLVQQQMKKAGLVVGSRGGPLSIPPSALSMIQPLSQGEVSFVEKVTKTAESRKRARQAARESGSPPPRPEGPNAAYVALRVPEPMVGSVACSINSCWWPVTKDQEPVIAEAARSAGTVVLFICSPKSPQGLIGQALLLGDPRDRAPSAADDPVLAAELEALPKPWKRVCRVGWVTACPTSIPGGALNDFTGEATRLGPAAGAAFGDSLAAARDRTIRGAERSRGSTLFCKQSARRLSDISEFTAEDYYLVSLNRRREELRMAEAIREAAELQALRGGSAEGEPNAKRRREDPGEAQRGPRTRDGPQRPGPPRLSNDDIARMLPPGAGLGGPGRPGGNNLLGSLAQLQGLPQARAAAAAGLPLGLGLPLGGL